MRAAINKVIEGERGAAALQQALRDKDAEPHMILIARAGRKVRLAEAAHEVRRCIFKRRAVSETLRSQSSKMRWMCSQRTRSADIGSSGGSGVSPSSANSARSTASASAGLGR